MKRIVCLLILVLTTLLSSTCFAFRDPDPNQWFFYSQNGTLDIWMHKTDVSRYQNNNNNGYYDPHRGHVYYTFWVLMQDNDTKEEFIFRKLMFGFIKKYSNSGGSDKTIVQAHSDDILDAIFSFYNNEAQKYSVLSGYSYEEIELNIQAFLTYCFIECKILERPQEG